LLDEKLTNQNNDQYIIDILSACLYTCDLKHIYIDDENIANQEIKDTIKKFRTKLQKNYVKILINKDLKKFDDLKTVVYELISRVDSASCMTIEAIKNWAFIDETDNIYMKWLQNQNSYKTNTKLKDVAIKYVTEIDSNVVIENYKQVFEELMLLVYYIFVDPHITLTIDFIILLEEHLEDGGLNAIKGFTKCMNNFILYFVERYDKFKGSSFLNSVLPLKSFLFPDSLSDKSDSSITNYVPKEDQKLSDHVRQLLSTLRDDIRRTFRVENNMDTMDPNTKDILVIYERMKKNINYAMEGMSAIVLNLQSLDIIIQNSKKDKH